MQFNKLYQENFFFFTTYINEEISKNVVKFKNIAIIYNNKYIENENNFLKIKNFCRKNNIKFFIIDNLKLAIKYKLDGIILSNKNKSNNHKENLRVISQRENITSYHRSKNRELPTGVFYIKNKRRYRAGITFNKKTIHLGYYDNAESASNAYQNHLKLISI